jgi:hypothetical protein
MLKAKMSYQVYTTNFGDQDIPVTSALTISLRRLERPRRLLEWLYRYFSRALNSNILIPNLMQ